MLSHNGEVHWDMNFIMLVHDWEVSCSAPNFNSLILKIFI
jgi:hypothetical protein